MKIDGKQIAAEILEDLKVRVEKLKEKNIIPNLYIILLSDDASSESYVKQKQIKGDQIGVKITVEKENFNITTDELVKKIEKLNQDKLVHGIIVQRPMPKTLDEDKIKMAVNPLKDVDGFNQSSNFKVPVSLAVLKILENVHSDNFNDWLARQRISVLGKGLTAGGPIINTIKNLGINPYVITSTTPNKKELLSESDIVISAVGKENIVSSQDLKKGSILIGVGMHKGNDGKFHGDFNEEEIQDVVLYYSPTPGGVGPVNVSMLLSNLVEATEEQIKKN
jgi:methylenetetrahydrofolate dehydrogenase (NADP+)/methenyltetrahydrofolate cyclohydrolase